MPQCAAAPVEVAPRGLLALSGFFALGAVIALITALAIVMPGGPLDPIWRLNPQAHTSFLTMGTWAIALLGVVAAACGSAAVGLWRRAWWGHALALTLLVSDACGNLASTVIRGELRTLIGVPIAVAFIVYLLVPGVRRASGRTRT